MTSLFINASDILLSMLFNLLLAGITILLYFFFLFLVVFNSFFTIPAEIENARLKTALTIPTGTSIRVENDAMGILSVVIDKTINDLSKKSNEAICLLSVLLVSSLFLISATK